MAIIVLVFLAIFSSFIFANRSIPACFSDSCFEVEIADDIKEREMGLMFRENLSDGSGMLFIFDESGIYPFWMKNTFIPLDIIWINENMEVVFIESYAMPCGEGECIPINPDILAKYVLEVNSGMVEKNNISIGDVMKWKKDTLF